MKRQTIEGMKNSFDPKQAPTPLASSLGSQLLPALDLQSLMLPLPPVDKFSHHVQKRHRFQSRSHIAHKQNGEIKMRICRRQPNWCNADKTIPKINVTEMFKI